MQKIAALTVATIATLTFAGACNVEEVDAPDATGVEDPSLDEMYTETVVDLDQGGKIISEKLISKRDQIARRDRLAELEAQGLGQSQEAIVAQDSDCVAPRFEGGFFVNRPVFSMWSAPDYTGFRLCFAGDGVAALQDYCMIPDLVLGGCLTSWDNVGAGSFKVSLFETTARFVQSATSPCSPCTQHSTSALVPDASTCEEGARYLLLDQAYSCPL